MDKFEGMLLQSI